MSPLPAISMRSQDLLAPVLSWVKKKLQCVPFSFLTTIHGSSFMLMVFLLFVTQMVPPNASHVANMQRFSFGVPVGRESAALGEVFSDAARRVLERVISHLWLMDESAVCTVILVGVRTSNYQTSSRQSLVSRVRKGSEFLSSEPRRVPMTIGIVLLGLRESNNKQVMSIKD